jgi:hypothetical protein
MGSGLPGQRLVRVLGRQHDVSLLDDDPRDREAAARATAAVDAIICGLPESPSEDPLVALDQLERVRCWE